MSFILAESEIAICPVTVMRNLKNSISSVWPSNHLGNSLLLAVAPDRTIEEKKITRDGIEAQNGA